MEFIEIVVCLIIINLICAVFCCHLARAKNLEIGAWFWGGFLFGLIALIAAAGMPERNDQTEKN